MAKAHDEPGAPRGVSNEKLHKHESTAREQDGLTPSPARPLTRHWNSASYDATTGRANIWAEPFRDRQLPSAGVHTVTPGQKPKRTPGRW